MIDRFSRIHTTLIAAMLLCAIAVAQVSAQDVVINEFMASNGSAFADADGDYSDWIELYNPTSETINLAGYAITDDPDDPYQWVFPPATTIEPGGFLIVWASNKDRADPAGELHTNFAIAAAGEPLILRNPAGDIVSEAPVQPLPRDVSFGRYPDGSGTWCVMVSITPGEPNNPASPAEIVINEVMALNTVTITDGDGEYHDWIELHNTGDAPVNLGGYGLSDDYDQPFLWMLPSVSVPAGGYLLVWASGKDRTGSELHTNYQISSSGEAIYLTAPDGTLLDASPPVPIDADISYGRSTDGAPVWGYFSAPTPGAPNLEDESGPPVSAPVFSVTPGFHTAPFDLAITSEDPTVTIRYTLDGSEPTEASAVYTGPLRIEDRTGPASGGMLVRTTTSYHPFHTPQGDVFRGTAVRARAFRDNRLPSGVVTATYFVTPHGSDHYDMPVASVSTDPPHLFDPDSGIYVPGRNTVSDQHLSPWANFHQRGEEWERSSHIEFFETDGSLALSQGTGVRIHGNYSREYHQKTLRLYARARYGERWFEHRFFPEKDVDRFRRILLRTGASDIFTALIRDGAIQELSDGLGFETQSYRPIAVFINGDYWGIHFIRDRYDRYHLEQHHDVNSDDVDLLEIEGGVAEAEAGTGAHYLSMVNYIMTQPIEQPDVYRAVTEMMDVDNFIAYCTAQIIAGNSDWPQKNVRLWRKQTSYDPNADPPTHDGRWRWLMYDVERGFGLRESSTPQYNTLAHAVDEGWPTVGFILPRLLQNPEFRTRFITRFSGFMNTAFTEERMREIVDSYANEIAHVMPEHIARWGEPESMEVWEGHIEIMRDFAHRRAGYIWDHYRTRFGLDPVVTMTLNATDADHGHIRVDGIDVDSRTPGVSANPYPMSWQAFSGVPMRLTAVPADGYAFERWHGVPDGMEHEDEITLVPDGPMTITAQFSVSTSIATLGLPGAVTLEPNAPNPFNPSTTLRFALPEAAHARLEVYALTGQRVAVIGEGMWQPGWHSVEWDGRDASGRELGSGVYLVRLTAGETSRTRRVTLVR